MAAPKSGPIKRSIQLFVLFGIPILGAFYVYQFTGQDRERVIPFQVFKAPQTPLQTPGTNAERALQLTEPITVVNFWATWCPPCVEEFPAMIELQRQLEDRGVELLFVSVDEKWEDVVSFLQKNNIDVNPARLYWDPSKKAAEAWGSTKFPETYVVRQDGWVLEKIIGLQLWTRPAVIDYFTGLAAKAAKTTSLVDLLIPRAYAQGGLDPIVHEDDKKTLEKIRGNIEVASKNLQNAEAALKEEDRNLQEQKLVLERRQREQEESQVDLDKLKTKQSELKGMVRKNESALQAELREQQSIEGQIKDIERKISTLEKQLEAAKDELAQARQSQNTRVQQVGTFNEASTSLDEEMKALQERIKAAEELVAQKRAATNETKSDIRGREKKNRELQLQATKSGNELERQKKKLADFEKILKK
jgi:cytochrome c biogenesis protein CcmG, thiol:disulfide interchange protein DsbE